MTDRENEREGQQPMTPAAVAFMQRLEEAVERQKADPRDAEIATLRAELAAARAETDRRVQAALEMAAGVAHERGEELRQSADVARQDGLVDRARLNGFRASTCYHLRDAIRSITPAAVAAAAEGQSRATPEEPK